jgi:hypothetical protein
METNSNRISDGVAPLPWVDSEQLAQIYEPPSQDKTRHEYAERFQQAESQTNVNVGGEGLKAAVSTFENSWYVATALVMSTGLGMVMYVPDGFSIKNGEVTALSDWVAITTYVILVLFGTMNSTLGVWWAGHAVPQVDWHPAATFGLFWFASLNTTLGQSQQFAKAGIVQLVLALVPLSYMCVAKQTTLWVGCPFPSVAGPLLTQKPTDRDCSSPQASRLLWAGRVGMRSGLHVPADLHVATDEQPDARGLQDGAASRLARRPRCGGRACGVQAALLGRPGEHGDGAICKHLWVRIQRLCRWASRWRRRQAGAMAKCRVRWCLRHGFMGP